MAITQIPPVPFKTSWSAVKQSALPTDADGRPQEIKKAGSIWFWGGTTGDLATSPDGITWTARTSGVAQNIYSFGTNATESIYLFGSNNASLRSSTDLITWTARTSNMGPGTEITDIIWDGAKFVAVGGRNAVSETKIITSTDGITWTARFTSQAQFNQIAYDGVGNYAAVGGGTSTSNYGIATSTNGTSWTMAHDSGGSDLTGVVWNGSVFICIAHDFIYTLTTAGVLTAVGEMPETVDVAEGETGKLFYDGQLYYTSSPIGVIQLNSNYRWQLNYTGFNHTPAADTQTRLAYAGGQFLGAQENGQLYFGNGPRAQ